MVNYYELFSDETYITAQSKKYMLLGGLICTEIGHKRLLVSLEQVRKQYGRRGEMKWNEISKSRLDFEAYKDWVDVFFEDRFARFVLFCINTSDKTWINFYRQKRQGNVYQEGLSSAYHQFLLVSFGALHDTKRWAVYPDNGLFRYDILKATEVDFNRAYKFPKSSNNIRWMRFRHSDTDDLLQLTDVLLGAFSHDYLHVSVDGTKGAILKHCKDALQQEGFNERRLPKLVSTDWVPPDQYDYTHNLRTARPESWTKSVLVEN